MTAGCFRHCGRDNPHRGAAGWAYAYFWRLWIWNRNFQLLGSCVSDIGRWFLSRNLTNWRQPVAHAQPFRGQFRCCQQPAAVLCWPLCDPRLSSGRRGVEGCGRVFPALSGKPRLQKRSWPVINTTSAATRTLMMPMKMKGRQATMTPLAIILPQAGTTRHRQQAAPVHTRILCQGSSPAVPQTCHHILPCHSLHASHDISERIVWRKMVGVC